MSEDEIGSEWSWEDAYRQLESEFQRLLAFPDNGEPMMIGEAPAADPSRLEKVLLWTLEAHGRPLRLSEFMHAQGCSVVIDWLEIEAGATPREAAA